MEDDGELIEYEGEEAIVASTGFQEFLVELIKKFGHEIIANKKIRNKIVLAYMTGKVDIIGLLLVDVLS